MTEVKVKVEERSESITDWLRVQVSVITHPVARLLNKWGVHPNTVTILGALSTTVAAAVVATGRLTLGGWLLFLTSSFDMFDGALARVTGKKSRFGAFLDSTLDRISEGILLFGLLVWVLSGGLHLEVYLIFASLLGSVLVSYTRARAEGVGYECKTGLLTRVGRVILMGCGLIFGLVRPMLIVLAALSWVTVLQRIFSVYRQSRLNP